MVKGSKLTYRLLKKCIICQGEFLSRQSNAKYCSEHHPLKKGFCKCGCGKEVLVNKSGYAHGCQFRGVKNTGNRVRCGFKKGALNPNTTTSQFQKFKLRCPDKIGQLFRSTLEARFSDLCREHNIKFDYEVRVLLLNGKTKVVDFSLDNNEIFIEITGYAYSKWQKDFDEKFRIFKQTVGDVPIIILTYPDKLSLVSSQNANRDVFIESIDNPIGILKKIQLFRVVNFSNKILKGNETVYIPQRIV